MTLSGKYENVLILLDVPHVEGLAVPLGHVVRPPITIQINSDAILLLGKNQEF